MLRTGYVYHFFTALVFIGLGIFMLVRPEVLNNKGLNPFWIGILLFVWGGFRVVNGYLVYKKQKREKSS